ncbi:MAG: SDR family oxidoreductase [Bacteroidetes bacterium]|nr:SDR family oxidoreductase [Bacteroidota bacterium]
MNILINGGSRGMGRETALRLAESDNNRVIVTGRDKNALRSLKGACSGKSIEVFDLDTTMRDNRLESLKNHLFSSELRIDVLINFAGLFKKASFIEASESDVRSMMETNYFGPAFFIREMVPYMSNPSHVLNIGSMGGFQGSMRFPGLAWYSASKAALANISESLAAELGDYGISVNCLCPGAVQTDMLSKAFPGYKAPITAEEAAVFLAEFALTGHKYFNGKVLPLSRTTP